MHESITYPAAKLLEIERKKLAILALADPCLDIWKVLLDFIAGEIKRREIDDPRRIRPVRTTLQNQRDDLLAFAGVHAVFDAVAQAMAQTPRSSALVGNLNPQLRNYFMLRHQLGSPYLGLLQLLSNHRCFLRSRRPERVGKSPAQSLPCSMNDWTSPSSLDHTAWPAPLVSLNKPDQGPMAGIHLHQPIFMKFHFPARGNSHVRDATRIPACVLHQGQSNKPLNLQAV